MKKYCIFLWMLLLFASKGYSADIYYVSNSGNDNWTGKCSNLPVFPDDCGPWATIDKANSLNTLIEPGDQILFERGGEWHGELIIAKSGELNAPIVYGAYGAGNKPVLNGAILASGWERTSDNPAIYAFNNPDIFAVTGIADEVKQLFLINGNNRERQTLARYPNDHYLTNIGFSTSAPYNQITGTSEELDQPDDYWNNTNIYFRYASYDIAKRKVSDYINDNDLIQMDVELPSWSCSTGCGYYFENKLEELDSPGEWFYDSGTETLYFWPPDGISLIGPDSADVEMSVLSSGITMDNNIPHSTMQYIRIENFDIRNFSDFGIICKDFREAMETEIVNNDISGIGDYGEDESGIRLRSAPINVVISGNKITDVQGRGVFLYQAVNGEISDNEINNVRHMGIYYSRGTNAVIKNNSVNQTGRGSIYVVGNFTQPEESSLNEVSGNIVRNSSLLVSGAGIYTQYINNSTIANNIVENVFGSIAGKPTNTTEAFGLHLDYNSHDMTVSGNTFINADYGIYLENVHDNVIQNNLVYSARITALGFYEASRYPDHLFNNTIENNILYTADSAEACVRVSTPDLNLVFGSFENNYYAQPLNYYAFVRHYDPNGREFLHLSEWQAISGDDTNSTALEDIFGHNRPEASLFVNFERNAGIFTLEKNYFDLYGSNISGPISVGALTAEILINDISPVAHWKLDEKGTTVIAHDSTDHMNDGLVNGGINWVEGKIEGALSFDGTSSRITIPDSSSLEVAGDLTISVWMYPDNIAKGRQSIVHKHYNYEYEILMEPDGQISFYHGDGDRDTNLGATGMVVVQDQWNHIVITRSMSDKTVYFYLNGNLIGSMGFNSVPAPSSNPVVLGHREGTGYYFSGKMDDVRIYNHVLSSSDIYTLNKSMLVAYWKLDEEGSGLTAIDASANGNHGTIIGDINWVQGETGDALSFDGINNRVRIPDSSSLEVAGDLTITGWIYPDNIAKGRQSIIYKHYSYEYEVMMEPTGEVHLYHGDGNWERSLDKTGMFLTEDQWNHIAIVRSMSDKTLSFYLNGGYIGLKKFQLIPVAGSNPVILGHRTGSDFYFSGKMDDMRMYNYPMMEHEIQEIYNKKEFIEMCDGRDNDGDGLVDEGYDEDNDSYSICENDWDDSDNTVYPGAPEMPGDGKDNDQDGLVDEVITWTGSTSGDWNTAGNWDINIVPQASDNVIIVAAPFDPVLPADTTVNNLTIESGELTLNDYKITVGLVAE